MSFPSLVFFKKNFRAFLYCSQSAIGIGFGRNMLHSLKCNEIICAIFSYVFSKVPVDMPEIKTHWLFYHPVMITMWGAFVWIGGGKRSKTDQTVILDQILNQLYSSLFIGNLFAKLQWAAGRSTSNCNSQTDSYISQL